MKKILSCAICFILLILKVYAQNEVETNNHFSQAISYNLNSTVNLSLASSGAVDIFLLQINRGGVLEINLNNIPNVTFYGLPIEFYVYDQDTSTLIYHYYHPNNPYYPNSVSEPVVVPAGNYYVKIKCDNNFSSSPKAFQLTINLDSTDNCEYNSSFITACPMPLDTVFPEKIYGYNLTDTSNGNVYGIDKDFFRIHIPRSGVLSLDLENIPKNGFYGLPIEAFVYDVLDTANIIAHYFHTLNPYYPTAIDYPVLLKSGDYYVKIQVDNNYSQSPIAFNTRFKLDTTEKCEYNNQFITACPAALNTAYSEKIYGYNLSDTTLGNNNGVDVDYYKITLRQDTTLDVEIHQIPIVGFYGLRLEFFIFQSDMSTVVSHYFHSGNPYYPTDISYATVLSAGTYYIKVQTDDYSEYPSSFNTSFRVSNIVPLTLISFQGDIDESEVDLSWKTASEFNTSHFNIEHSLDGINFIQIGKIAAAENTNIAQNYHFIDKKPNKGNNLYRLKMIDIDGKYSYSDIVKINFGTKLSLTISPNPVKEILLVQIHKDESEHVLLQIADMQGKILYQQDQELSTGSTSLSINTSSLSKGLYRLVIKGNKIESKPFLKE